MSNDDDEVDDSSVSGESWVAMRLRCQKCVHRLVLDDIVIAHFVELTFGACMPDRCPMEAVTRDSYTTDTCPVLYLSCSGMNFSSWGKTIALAHAAMTDLLDTTIRLKLAQGEERPPPKKKSKPACKPAKISLIFCKRSRPRMFQILADAI